MNPEQNTPQNQQIEPQPPQVTATPPSQAISPVNTPPVTADFKSNPPLQQPQYAVPTPIITTSTTPGKSSKKRVLLVVAIVVAICIAVAIGGIVALNSSSSTDSEKDTNTQPHAGQTVPLSQSKTDEEQVATPAQQDSTALINDRDTQRKYNLSKIASFLTEYQMNNNGKIPADAASAQQVLSSYQQDSIPIADPLTKKEYVFISYTPTIGSTFEIQYAPQQTCSGNELSSSSSRSFALRSYLESGELICLSS